MSDEIKTHRDPLETEVLTESQDTAAAATAPLREERFESTPVEPARTPATSRRQQETVMPLLSGSESHALRTRWESLQVSFIDEPRHSVEEADRLVSEAINTLSSGFATEREKLEQQWHRGEDASTEDLRLALRRYRSFFERLLAI